MAKVTGNFYIGSDTQVQINGLKDASGAFINDALLVGTLQDKKQNVVATDVTFTYLGGNGNYVGSVPPNVVLKENVDYDLMIQATQGGRQMTLRIRRKAAYVDG
jgi:hypothetical protein